MNTCSWCGHAELEPGFFEDRGQGSRGYVAWVQGALERGMFGGAKLLGRPRWVVEAQRCVQCGHLEMFATHRTSSAD